MANMFPKNLQQFLIGWESILEFNAAEVYLNDADTVGRAVRSVVGRASETLRTYSQTFRVATTNSPGFFPKITMDHDHSATP